MNFLALTIVSLIILIAGVVLHLTTTHNSAHTILIGIGLASTVWFGCAYLLFEKGLIRYFK